MKVAFHKFALIVNNPQGAGQKSSSDRLGYAIFFIFFGPVILALDSLVDCFWFIKHVYKTDLDVIAKQKQEDRGFGITNSVNQKTFKKMLNYFEMQSGKDMQQIALQRDVTHDIRDYLNVEDAIAAMMFGGATKKEEVKKSYMEKGTEERVNKTLPLDQSEFTNAT